jgi:SynChlorMet cassette radical SAM/SPASM protein ScmF
MDGQHFPLTQIYFYLTQDCNLRCRHCWIVPKAAGDNQARRALPLDFFRSIIDQAKSLGLSGVKLTGGEPLIHPQIYDILNCIRENDLSLSVETNGVRCTPELAKQMSAAKQPSVSVSLDSPTPEIHEWLRGVTGCFKAATRGICNLVEAGTRPQVIMTIFRKNVHQMEELVRLAESLGASSVKFNIMQPTGRGEDLWRNGEAVEIEELLDLGNWVETSIPLFFSHPMAFRPLSKMFGEGGCGCGTCGIRSVLGVLGDGSYALCGIGETVPQLVFGHAASDSLEDVWNNTDLLKELREGLPERLQGICRDCLLKGRCLGHCVAQSYYRCSTLWASQWYCEEAARIGQFPKTRLYSRVTDGK